MARRIASVVRRVASTKERGTRRMLRLDWTRDVQPARVAAVGLLDGSVVISLVSAARRVAPERGGAVVVDLSNVTFFESAAARALLDLRSELARNGTKLRLENVPYCVAQTFDSVGVPTMVPREQRLD